MLALAEHGSFCRAAEAMNITQPALSRSIQSLEDSLGVQLFDRSTRKIKLTPIGEVSIEAARQILRSAAEFHSKIGNTEADEIGELRIGLGSVTSSLFGAPLLRAYAQRFPKMRISLRVDQPESLYKMLLREELDVVVGNTDAIENAHDFDFEVTPSFTRGFFARAAHPLAGRRNLDTDDLALYPVGTTDPLPAPVVRAIKSTYGFASLDSFFHLRSNHYSALVDLMLHGDAVVFGANIAYLQEVRRGLVVRLDVKPEFPMDMPLTIATIAGQRPKPATALVGEVVRAEIAA